MSLIMGIFMWVSGIGKAVGSILDFIQKGIDAVIDFGEVVAAFVGDIMSPLLNFLPTIFGNTIGVLLTVVIIVYIAISMWEAVH